MIWFLYLAVMAIFTFLAYSIYKEIKGADSKKRLTLVRQYVGILIMCIVVFALCKTVFKEEMSTAYYYLTGAEVIEPVPHFDPELVK